MCLEIILTYNEEVDDAMGLERALVDTTIPFKVAFNTLLNYEILKEIDELSDDLNRLNEDYDIITKD